MDYCGIFAQGKSCEANRDGRFWGTALQIRPLLGNRFVTLINGVTWEVVFSTRSLRWLRDATVEGLLREMFSLPSLSMLYKESIVPYVRQFKAG